MIPSRTKGACLVVIDGWGMSPVAEGEWGGDAIRQARTPTMDTLAAEYGCTPLLAHGEAVGLPDGLMGNSEVGHLNIGAGRVVYQDILRINKLLEQPSVEVLGQAVATCQARNARLHLIGLLSDGGVHSHIEHLLKILDHLDNRVPISIHAITDGRDTAPKCALPYFDRLHRHTQAHTSVTVASITGRYWAMDRDKRWERTEAAVQAMCVAPVPSGRVTEWHPLAEKLIQQRYDAGETDEFLAPMVINPAALIKDGDALVFFNFRSDRMRQLVQVLGQRDLPVPMPVPLGLWTATMTKYREDFMFPVLSPPQVMTNVLAEWLAVHGVAQMHVAETEKFSHVTVFFNGGREQPYEGEERVLVPSPKVATYDLKPEMSCMEVAGAVAQALATGRYGFVMCNFAPPDMVGHTGKLPEAILACEATDAAVALVWEACKAAGYTLLVTADHGNAEKMICGATGGPHKAHTCAKVPLIVTGGGSRASDATAALCDVAPTVLQLMGLPQPPEMTGKSVLR